jgi:hypothetical protein
MQWLQEVEKYSLAIQFIFSSLDNFEILQRAYSFSVDYNVISCKDTFLAVLYPLNYVIKGLFEICFQYLTDKMDVIFH